MKNTTHLFLAAALFSVIGCSEAKKTETAPATVQPAAVSFPQSLDSAGTSAPGAVTPQPAAPAGATAQLNPPHGEPGHSCAIPVGAPLNSAPSTPTITSGGTAPAATLPPAPVMPSAPPISTAKGLNPPHGQPGHDCAIPVGAPLKN